MVIDPRYMISGADGVEHPAEVTTATVEEAERVVYCGVTFEDGQSVISTVTAVDRNQKFHVGQAQCNGVTNSVPSARYKRHLPIISHSFPHVIKEPGQSSRVGPRTGVHG